MSDHRLHPSRLLTRLEFRTPYLRRVLTRVNARRFDGLAPRWDDIRASMEESTRMLESVLDELGLDPPQRVIDVGTGTGQAALMLARHFPGAVIDAVDASPEMIARARQKAPSGRVRFTVADGGRLPFGDGAFDLAVSLLVQPFPRELRRVLRAGGWAVFMYPMGPGTPIWFPAAMLRPRLLDAGFDVVRSGSISAGEWTAGRR